MISNKMDKLNSQFGTIILKSWLFKILSQSAHPETSGEVFLIFFISLNHLSKLKMI